MNIKKLFDRKDELEDELIDISREVQDRWEKLLGFGCGYFDDWSLHKGIVSVGYEHRGSHGHDEIPAEFFEMDDADEAKERYSAYMKAKREKEDDSNRSKMLAEEKTLYMKLKEKFEGKH